MTVEQNLIGAAGVYLKPRVLLILLFGFSSGLPLALSGSTLTLWMADVGVDLRAIGLYALAGLPYTLKFLWAPAVDALRVPWLSQRLGRRRAWLVLSQLVLMVAIVFLGALNPLDAPFLVALGAVIVATASATQDIVIDAFRIESLDDDEQAAGMAYYVSAYRVALLVSTAGVIFTVAFLERIGVSQSDVWFYGYAGAAVLVLVGLAASLLAHEPEAKEDSSAHASVHQEGAVKRFIATAVDAFKDILAMPHILAILSFVVLFKFCDALAGVMTGPFVLDIGFDKESYAAIVKGAGLAAVLAGGFAGGFAARALTQIQSLWLAALLQMLSNLIFIWQAWIGPEHWALVITIITENFAGGIGTVIFVAYLSALCGATRHTATLFALLTALAAVGRTILSASSGFIAVAAGWPLFFLITAGAAVPALLLLVRLQRQGHFLRLDELHQLRAAAPIKAAAGS